MASCVLVSDTCLRVARAVSEDTTVARESSRVVRVAMLIHWAEVQVCWGRVAHALLIRSDGESAVRSLSEAAAVCRECVAKYSSSPERTSPFVFVHGVCRLLTGDTAGILTVVQGIRLSPSVSSEWWQFVGELLEKSRHPAETLLCYRRAADDSRGMGGVQQQGGGGKARSVAPLLRYALCCLSYGDAEGAVDAASEAMRVDNGVVATWLVLALAKQEIGDHKGAKKAFARAAASIDRVSSLVID